MPYSLKFKPGWDIHFSKMGKSFQRKIWKKIQAQKRETKTRHMRFGVEFSVVESGQYRIALKIDEDERSKKIHFVGNHKQYEKWLKGMKN